MFLDLDKSYHTYCEQGWEDLVCENTKHPFWIELQKKNLKHPTEHLPNFYEFKHNLDVVDSNIIGFAEWKRENVHIL